MNKKLLFLFAIAFLSSCTSYKNIQPYVDYTNSISVQYELEKAQDFLADDPLESLVRAQGLKQNSPSLLDVDSLFFNAGEQSLKSFEKAIEEKDWVEATILFKSLDILGLSPEDWSLEKINEENTASLKKEGNTILAHLDIPVQSSPEDEAPSSAIVAKMIQGTVTVWVDRGLSIRGGVGYADRVIGSGFFIDPRGYIITNYHVIESEVNPQYEGYSRLYIKTADAPETRIPARVIGWDPILDIALLKTELDPKVVFTLGSSEDLKVGNRIYAIGSPAGLEQTLTSGIVSAQKRRFLSIGDILQIDAPINHGNSGGPIIDELGRVQAVVFAGIEPYEGLNFAIPVEYLRLLLPRLYEGGKVSHSWLSSFGKTWSLSGSKENFGVELVYTLGSGSLDRAGVQAGSIITAVNSTPVTSLEELQTLILRERPGTIIKLSGIPADLVADASIDSYTIHDWYVRLSARPEQPGKLVFDSDLDSKALLPTLGLKLEQVGRSKKYLVMSVVAGSIADELGFSEQDVVELKKIDINEKSGIISVQLYAKKRKSGYIDSFIGLAASLDSPSYF